MCGKCGSKTYNVNKVDPVHDDSYEVDTPRYGRINGWSCPWNPFQFIGWFFIVLFAVTHFAILVFYLPLAWQSAGVIIPACGYIVHLVYHFLALTLDPADPAVRKKGIFIKRTFDRKKQSHVIENCYCHICQTEVASKSKHCSVCNKCVSDFDHHCKWLNNCVGGRNYKLFLGSCISSFITGLIMFIIDVYLIIVYYSDHNNVLPDAGRCADDWRLFVLVCKEAYIVFTIVNACLLLISMGLMGHLLVFHGYLLCHNMSTYEYIVQEREKASMENSDVESAGEPGLPPKIQSPLTSTHHEENLYIETSNKKTTSYEMQSIDQHYDHIKSDGRLSRTSRDGLLVDEKQYHAAASYELYETPLPGQVEETVVETDERRKKQKQYKKRTSSKLALLNSDQDDELSTASSPSPSRHSRQSSDSELKRYELRKEENVLEDFSSPKVTRLSSRSKPSRLEEETLRTRNESVVSRPRSPSPKSLLLDSTQFVETDFVMNTQGKTSMSSLSTLHLQEPPEDILSNSPSSISKSITSPTPQESVHSKMSLTRLLSPLQEDLLKSEEILDQPVLIEDARIITPTPSLSQQPIFGSQEQKFISSVNGSLVSQLSSPPSLSNAALAFANGDASYAQARRSPRSSASSVSTLVGESNVEQRFLSSPLSASHTKLTNGVPEEEKQPEDINANDLKVTNVRSDSEDTLVFEDEFLNISDQNSDFLQQSVLAANANLQTEERRKKLSRSPNAFTNNPPYDQSGVSDAESAKILPYVDAFKRKRDSYQCSFGSESEDSGPPLIATLNEEADTYALKDSLQRVKKLSDAFPAAIDAEKLKKRSLPHPRFRSTESMAEISVVEYNRKKKLKKKRPSSSSGGHNGVTASGKKGSLPPITGRTLLPDVVEEKNA